MKAYTMIPSFKLHLGCRVEQRELDLYIDSNKHVFFIEQKQKRIQAYIDFLHYKKDAQIRRLFLCTTIIDILKTNVYELLSKVILHNYEL